MTKPTFDIGAEIDLLTTAFTTGIDSSQSSEVVTLTLGRIKVLLISTNFQKNVQGLDLLNIFYTGMYAGIRIQHAPAVGNLIQQIRQNMEFKQYLG